MADSLFVDFFKTIGTLFIIRIRFSLGIPYACLVICLFIYSRTVG